MTLARNELRLFGAAVRRIIRPRADCQMFPVDLGKTSSVNDGQLCGHSPLPCRAMPALPKMDWQQKTA